MKLSKAKILLSLFLFSLLSVAGLAAQENELCFECHNDPELVGSRGDTLYVDSEKFSASIHNRNGVECVGCHQDLAGYEDWPHSETLEKVDCSGCHSEAFEQWQQGVHGLPARKKGDLDAASCADCHGSHYIMAVREIGSQVYPFALPYTCLNCHGDSSMEQKHKGMGQAKKAKLYLNSVHAQALEKNGLIVSAICSSCHGSHKILPLSEFYTRIPEICGGCHTEIYRDYLEGVHGKGYLQANPDVPICTDCHGEHDIKSPGDPESSVNPRQVSRLCSRCHEDTTLSRKYGLPLGRLASYRSSFHGIALNLGDVSVANCASCHDYHNVRPSSDPESTIHPDNLVKTCGKCHPNARENFARGKIHLLGKPEENIGAWLVKKAYLVLITALIGGFIAYIFLDLAAHHRRRQSTEFTQKKNRLGL